MTNHRKPLAPGEIRMHTVGTRTFQVMHVAGGSFTQASYRDADVRTVPAMRVLATERFESDVVRAYADAIEQAESDAADAMEGDDTPEPLTAEGVEALAARAGFTIDVEPARPLDLCRAIAEARHFEEVDRAALARGESPNWWERAGDSPTPAPAPTLADDVAALRAKVGNYGGVIQDWRDGKAPTESEKGSAERFGVFAAWADIEATLDRIAGAAPQRATDSGMPLWLHDCGWARGGQVAPSYCNGCRTHGQGAWRALYVLPDGA